MTLYPLARPQQQSELFVAPPIRVLVVEDCESDAFYIQQALAGAPHGYAYALTNAQSLLDAIRQLNAAPFDIIILDLNLLDINGMVTVTALRSEAPHIPIIVYSGMADARLKVRALRSGAACYVVKGHEHELGLAYIVENTLAYGRQIHERALRA